MTDLSKATWTSSSPRTVAPRSGMKVSLVPKRPVFAVIHSGWPL